MQEEIKLDHKSSSTNQRPHQFQLKALIGIPLQNNNNHQVE